MVIIKDVVVKVGVNLLIVSCVLKDNVFILSKMKECVKKVMEELGYVFNVVV